MYKKKKGNLSFVFYPAFMILLMIILLSSVASYFASNGFPFNVAYAHDALINVGIKPLGIEYNPTNGDIYVANAGSSTVTVINGSDPNNPVTQTILVGRSPVSLDYMPSDNQTYVANFWSENVYVIGGSPYKVVDCINVGKGPFGITHDSSKREVYVGNMFDKTVSVINASVTDTKTGNSTLTSVSENVTSGSANGTSITAGGNQLKSDLRTLIAEARLALQYNDTQGAQMHLDLALNALKNDTYANMTANLAGNGTTAFEVGMKIANISIIIASPTAPDVDEPQEPFQDSDSDYGTPTASNAPATSPPSDDSSKKACVNSDTNRIELFNQADEKVRPQPFFMTYSGKNDFSNGEDEEKSSEGALYVSGFPPGAISIINTVFNTQVNDIRVEGSPAGISYNPKNNNLYVGNFASNDVSVINPTDNSKFPSIKVKGSPIDIVYDNNTEYMYATNFESDTVSVIDSKANSFKGYFAGNSSSGINSSFGIIYYNSPGPNNKHIYITNPNSDTVTMIHTEGRKISQEISQDPDLPLLSVAAIAILIVLVVIVYFSIRMGWAKVIVRWFHLR